MDFICLRQLSILVILLCVLISLKRERAETKKSLALILSASSNSSPMFLSNKAKKLEDSGDSGSLQYDFYRETCPQAEYIIRSRVRNLYDVRSNVAPALLRLVFHDCFIEGCDASVLLDTADGVDSEKEAPPNETLKGFDLIDIIKSDLEEACHGIVSCADILVLAARESVALAGGPFYPLQTGRRDSPLSFPETATYELPSPQDDLPKTIAIFATRGFDERETVSLLGAHSIGTVNCKFIISRLYNFDGTNEADPTLDREFLNQLRSRCKHNRTSPLLPQSPSLSPLSANGTPPPISVEGSLSSFSTQEPKVEMDYEGRGSGGFGMLYYRRLLQARAILFVDQQLTTGTETETWVRAYASDVALFRRDFALVMMKLSNLGVLTQPTGQVRINCSKVVA